MNWTPRAATATRHSPADPDLAPIAFRLEHKRLMRIGIVGAGRMGAFHARTLAGLPDVDEIVITDADPARARMVADTVGAAVADSLPGMLRGGVAGLAIATPASTHGDLIRVAAAAERPIFCEKPLAQDVLGTLAALEVVSEAGVALHVGFQRRFDAGFTSVREAVRSGRLGWLHTLRLCTADPAPPLPSYLSTSGGIFRDCAIHDFDLVRWITGVEVAEVFAVGGNRGDRLFADMHDVDTAIVTLTLSDGALAVCTATRYNGAGYDVRLEACGSAGTMVAGLDERTPVTCAGLPPVAQRGAYAGFIDRFGAAYRTEMEAFCEVVRGDRASPCDGRQALAAILIAEAATWSLHEHRSVTLAEVGAAYGADGW